jgi:DHA1 family multidrug resistance protein-like MFS transporter
MLCRFVGGCFASAPLAIVGGAFADFWNPVDRGVAVCVFAAATFIGPAAGPIMGYSFLFTLGQVIYSGLN